MQDLTAHQNRRYDFKAPIDPKSDDVDALLRDLIATKAFQRLKHIRFLGAIDYSLVPHPNGKRGHTRYTRYQHSLGVVRLALSYGKLKALDPGQRQILYGAALLHDIGHAPLSHSLETVFRQEFDIDHHRATADVIRGQVPLGVDVLATLQRAHVDVERLIATIYGHNQEFDDFFAGPINFDTIEGISRSQLYGMPRPRQIEPESVMLAAMYRANRHDRDVVDQFWRYKDYVYQNIINSDCGALADFAAQTLMRRAIRSFTRHDYFVTEEMLFKKLPDLRRILTLRPFASMIAAEFGVEFNVKTRRFFVDDHADFFSRRDRQRYHQTKSDCFFSFQHVKSVDPIEVARELFDDAVGG